MPGISQCHLSAAGRGKQQNSFHIPRARDKKHLKGNEGIKFVPSFTVSYNVMSNAKNEHTLPCCQTAALRAVRITTATDERDSLEKDALLDVYPPD